MKFKILPALLLTCALFVAVPVGCEYAQRVQEGFVTPDPVTGRTPADEITGRIPNLIVNPLSYVDWASVVSAIAGVLVGAYNKDRVKALLTRKPPTVTG